MPAYKDEKTGTWYCKFSIHSVTYYMESRVLPYFNDKPINEISPAYIRKWQNGLITDGLRPTTQHTINAKLNTVLNFAVKYYGLQKNPCSVTGLRCGEVLALTPADTLRITIRSAVPPRPV